MSEAVKTPHINLSYDCDASIIGELVDFLKSKYRSIDITVNSMDDDEELVNIRETDFWKENVTSGRLLQGYRLKHGMTQRQLAKASGISYATLSEYEHDRRKITPLAARRLAVALDEDAETFHARLQP